MLTLIKKDYTSGVAHFGVSQTSELNKLPRIGVAGKDELNTVYSCAACSTCICTATGQKYILDGDSNTWKSCSSGSGTIDPGTGDTFVGMNDQTIVDWYNDPTI